MCNPSPKTAPKSWAKHCWDSEIRLHQLSPYIGKLKSSIASDLIATYTKPGDVVLDPFCGSGTIPLECALTGRHPIASDASVYAYVLASAKLHPPRSLEEGLCRLDHVILSSKQRPTPDLRQIPQWVRRFFHPATLRDAIQFADECILRNEHFLLACLLGILHHQRPGFLSFPSSHLVPYLRERNFPRLEFPELYEKRELRPRMIKKITRALEDIDSLGRVTSSRSSVHNFSVEELRLRGEIDAIVTSPPYMNALDYVRDNRLRMWFLDRTTANYSAEPTDRLRSFETTSTAFIRRTIPRLKRNGTCVLVVGETVRRKRMTSHPAELLLDLFSKLAPEMSLKETVRDTIPDVRRSRRDGKATKRELILVLSKKRG